jgi:hypothetical protein
LLSASLILALVTGCSSYSAVSDYERLQEQKKSFEETVASAGGKMEKKNYKVANRENSAWNMNFANAKITDGLIDSMVGMGYIGEVDFSRSSITDAQLLKMDELNLLQFTMNLDLSNTEITDESFSKLKGLRAVKTVKLKGSKVTKAGADAFKQAYLANQNTIPLFKKPVIEL